MAIIAVDPTSTQVFYGLSTDTLPASGTLGDLIIITDLANVTEGDPIELSWDGSAWFTRRSKVTSSDGNQGGLVVDGDKKWRANGGVTEKPVLDLSVAVAVDSATVTEYALVGVNATAVKVRPKDASVTGVKVVLNAANKADAWAEINAGAGVAALATPCPPNEWTFIGLGNVADTTLTLDRIHLSAAGATAAVDLVFL